MDRDGVRGVAGVDEEVHKSQDYNTEESANFSEYKRKHF